MNQEAIKASNEVLQQNLGDAYLCGRVWEAWSYGTMSEDDFSPAGEDEEFTKEVTEEVVTTYLKSSGVEEVIESIDNLLVPKFYNAFDANDLLNRIKRIVEEHKRDN